LIRSQKANFYPFLFSQKANSYPFSFSLKKRILILPFTDSLIAPIPNPDKPELKIED
jgi:hypothetical protein